LYGVNSLEHRLRAREFLQASITNAYRDATNIRNLSLAARAIGIGTHNIFNQLNTDGRLDPLVGPFAGQPLHPLVTPHVTNDECVRPDGTIIDHYFEAGAHPTRKIPILQTDQSLRKTR
jgi:hypothetical protein